VSCTFVICVYDKSATLSGTCRGLCRKVGVMEFGLNKTKFAKKYAMLTLSLDIICDVIGYLRNAAVKSAMSK